MNTTSDAVLDAPVTAQYANPSDFASLLDKEFKPKTDEARDAVEAAVRTLAEQALVNAATMTDDAYSSIEAIIAEIDRKLSEQINLVLHKDDFQKVESAWRGMHHLVYNTETDEKLKIRFMDVSKDEVRRTLRRHKGIAWDQRPIFKRI
jgi:type VI secretion system protein ImpC